MVRPLFTVSSIMPVFDTTGTCCLFPSFWCISDEFDSCTIICCFIPLVLYPFLFTYSKCFFSLTNSHTDTLNLVVIMMWNKIVCNKNSLYLVIHFGSWTSQQCLPDSNENKWRENLDICRSLLILVYNRPSFLLISVEMFKILYKYYMTSAGQIGLPTTDFKDIIAAP